MSFGQRVRHLFARDAEPASATTKELDEFIAVRQAALRNVTDSELAAMSDAALATVDGETTLREVDELRERWKVQSRQRARRPS